MSISSERVFQMGQLLLTEVKKNPRTTVAIGLTAIPAIEMALRGVKEGCQIASGRYEERDLEDIKWNASANLGGALLYGICALNPIPTTRLLGAVSFVGYSLFFSDRNATGLKASYIASKFIYVPVDYALEHVIVPLWNHVIYPITLSLWNNVFKPIVEKVWDVVKAILKLISLPKHPSWYVVAVLIAAIFLYRQAGGKVNLPLKIPDLTFS